MESNLTITDAKERNKHRFGDFGDFRNVLINV
jgi:hypothetical protein